MRRPLSLALALILAIAPLAVAGPNKITLRPPEDATIDLVPDPTGGFLITITAPPVEPPPPAPQPPPPAVQPPQQPSTPTQAEPPAVQPRNEPQPQPQPQHEARSAPKRRASFASERDHGPRLDTDIISSDGRKSALIYVIRPGEPRHFVQAVPIDEAPAALARWRARLGEFDR